MYTFISFIVYNTDNKTQRDRHKIISKDFNTGENYTIYWQRQLFNTFFYSS